jgi:hypothetical protein
MFTIAVLACGAAATAQQAADPAGPHDLLKPAQPDKVVERPIVRSSDDHGASLKKGPGFLNKFPTVYRTIDATGNNVANPDWGTPGNPLLRLANHGYEDGVREPPQLGLPSAREVSNTCADQSGSVPNSVGASDFLWQWGQFIDHDIDLSPIASPSEFFNIDIPFADPVFDPFATGVAEMELTRSAYTEASGVRQQLNVLTSYIDGSNVYGSDALRADALRAHDGTGRLATSAGNLLPFNTAGFPNAGGTDPSLFLAGDERANEQVGLTAMHTLFMRNHNWWADYFAGEFPTADDDTLYELSRAMNVAEIQVITYNEFVPILLGNKALPKYKGYKPNVNASVSNEFATAAYRVGHTMLSNELQRLDANGNATAGGPLPLANAFFRPDVFVASGIDNLLRGLASQPAQEIDPMVVDAVRNFLFAGPGSPGFDLASLNLQRGRDHGLARYNQARVAFGLPAATSFADISPDPAIQANLAAVYASVDDVDLWIGGLSEPHANGSVVGETFHAILSDQFLRLRDGDRFWYEDYLEPPIRNLVKKTTLTEVIQRNTGIGNELQKDAFRVP